MASLFSNPDLLALMGSGTVVGVVALIWQALRVPDRHIARLRALAKRRQELAAAATSKKSRRSQLTRQALMQQVVSALHLANAKNLAEVKRQLLRAGQRGREAVTVYFFSKFALALGLFGGTFLLTTLSSLIPIKPGLGLLAAMVLGIIGWVLPDVLIKNTQQKREEIIRKAMPDALDLMVICAEAGLSMDAAFERVAREMGGTCPALAEELGLVVVELNMLPTRQQALHNLIDRVGLPGVQALVNTLLQTEKYGTPLAQALRVLSAELREERMMKAEEKAASLPAKLTVPMILFILPCLFLVLMGPAIIRVTESMK